MAVDNKYVLKHKNEEVLYFKTKKNNITEIEIINKTWCPINYTKGYEILLQDYKDWFNKRRIPDSRIGIEKIKRLYKINNLNELTLMSMGLSLSDHYWIQKINENYKWENINYFDNRYSEDMGNIMFGKYLVKTDNDSSTPDIVLEGHLEKRWKYDKNTNDSYLIKGGSGKYKQEPFNEYFASELFEHLNIKRVKYTLEKEEDNWISKCKCIINKDTEMVSALDIINKYDVNDDFDDYVNIGEERKINGFRSDIEKMLVCDYIIGNIDRHNRNYGIIRNSNNGNWIETIPLFDNGYCLWNNLDTDIDENIYIKTFNKTLDENIENIDISKYIDKNKIKDMIDIYDKTFEYFEDKNRKKDVRKALFNKLKTILYRIC